MSQLFNGSICLSDILKEKVTTSEKNGKKYLNINIWLNDEPDQYGNSLSINISQSAEEREQKAKKVYIGNAKKYEARQTAAPLPTPKLEDTNDLPF